MRFLVFDFDSTLVRGEGLDELFARSVAGSPDRAGRIAEFRELTDRGMAGELPFAASLERRLGLLEADRKMVREVARGLARDLTPSVAGHAAFFREHREWIYVVSGGFRELIEPAARRLGIDPGRIGANRFRYHADGRVAGLDPDTPLARGGKAQVLRGWGLDPGRVWVVGDGATDLELREAGLARRFIAFTENRRRETVVARADAVASSIPDLIRILDSDE